MTLGLWKSQRKVIFHLLFGVPVVHFWRPLFHALKWGHKMFSSPALGIQWFHGSPVNGLPFKGLVSSRSRHFLGMKWMKWENRISKTIQPPQKVQQPKVLTKWPRSCQRKVDIFWTTIFLGARCLTFREGRLPAVGWFMYIYICVNLNMQYVYMYGYVYKYYICIIYNHIYAFIYVKPLLSPCRSFHLSGFQSC